MASTLTAADTGVVTTMVPTPMVTTTNYTTEIIDAQPLNLKATSEEKATEVLESTVQLGVTLENHEHTAYSSYSIVNEVSEGGGILPEVSSQNTDEIHKPSPEEDQSAFPADTEEVQESSAIDRNTTINEEADETTGYTVVTEKMDQPAEVNSTEELITTQIAVDEVQTVVSETIYHEEDISESYSTDAQDFLLSSEEPLDDQIKGDEKSAFGLVGRSVLSLLVVL